MKSIIDRIVSHVLRPSSREAASRRTVSQPANLAVEPLEERTVLSAISDAAYPVLNERVGAHQYTSYVFRDGDLGGNLGFPSGFFGQFSKLHVRTDCVDDPAASDGCTTDPNRLDRVRGTVMQVIVDPQRPGDFTGFNVEEPEH